MGKPWVPDPATHLSPFSRRLPQKKSQMRADFARVSLDVDEITRSYGSQ
jgi:hypothetical protein